MQNQAYFSPFVSLFKTGPISALLLVSAFFLWAGCSGKSDSPAHADTILIGGTFFTADSTEAEALAIQGQRILAVGRQEDMLKLKGPATKVMDLKGAFVMPGLIEGHGHFYAFGKSLIQPNFITATSWDTIVQTVARVAQNTESSRWIEGRGWHQEKWSVPTKGAVEGYPTHHSLSKVTPDHPVILNHASGHALMANARAMELAGITAATKDPIGGRIVRDAKGEPIGVFEENAMDLIQSKYQAWLNDRGMEERYAEFAEGVKKATNEALRNGVTSFQDAGSTLEEIEFYERMAKDGLLNTRLWAMILQPKAHEFGLIKGHKHNATYGFLTVQGMKAYFDGALGSYGAWLLEPYADNAASVGQNTTAIDTLRALAAVCKEQNLQFCVHAIGDRANREVLNVFEATLGSEPNDRRWRIEHAQHVDPADQKRFAQLGVIASMQPIHCTSDQPFVVKRLGEARAKSGAYPWRSLIDSGAKFCCGTDVPVEALDPFANMYAAVTRKRLDNGASLYPEQSLTRREVLLAYTTWNAWAAREEGEKGKLKAGMLADIVVLDRNLLECPVEQIPATKVLHTILGGKVNSY